MCVYRYRHVARRPTGAQRSANLLRPRKRSPAQTSNLSSFALAFSLAPLMTVERSPTVQLSVKLQSRVPSEISFDVPGNWKGKSRAANMMAAKIHHPSKSVTNVSAPPAMRSLPAKPVLPSARCQYAPDRHPKAPTRVRKMPKKTRLVRREQIM